MSSNKIKDRIVELGQAGDGEKLEKLVMDQSPEELVSLVGKNITCSDGISLLTYTMEGLQNKETTQKTRLSLLKASLKEIMTANCLQAATVKTYIEELQNCIRNFNSASISDVVDFLQRNVEDLNEREGEDIELTWINLFSTLLEEIKDLHYITPKDSHVEITGLTFRQQIISSLCETRWGPRIAIAMGQMFQDAKLTSTEIGEVFSKMLVVLNRTPVNDMAPLFHQLLKLVSTDSVCSGKLINSITQYFITKLNFAERQQETETSLESSDLIQSNHSSEEVQQTEAIIVYYIAQAAKMGHPIFKEVLKIARASVSFPATILNPFGLLICLALTSVKQQSATILESLKSIISKAFSISESRDSCAWFRDNTPAIPNIKDLFSLVISQSVRFGGWDLIGQGLVDLSFMLLHVQPAFGKMNSKTRSLHNLASAILAKVIKKHPSSAQIIIPLLQDRIIVNGSSIQYTSALRVIVKEATTFLMEDNNGTLIVNYINNFHRLSYAAGRASLNALMPLLRINRSLRVPLILVLRKALFSKNVDTRKIGVSGVYILLKSFKISNNMASSQSLSQSSGSLSQLSIDIHRSRGVTNESLCAELLGVLKICFSLQPKVKMLFYGGMSEVVSKNPDVCEGFLELLNGHVVELFGSANSEETRLNLDLSKTITEKGNEWVICEPAGWFIHCIQTLVTKGQQIFSGGESSILDKLAAFLDKITQYYANSELGDLGFDVSDNYDPKTLDGKKRVLKIDVLITLYEALMEYTMSNQGATNVEKAETLLQLCQRYQPIKHLLEGAKSQPKKGGGGKKGEKVKKEDKEDGGGGEDAQAKGEKDKGTKRTADGKEKDLDVYTMELCAFSLSPVAKFLQSVLEDRLPENQAALTKIRDDPGFLTVIETIMKTLLERTVGVLNMTGDEGVHSDSIFKSLLNATIILFRHCVTCEEPIEDFLQPCSQILLNYIRVLFTHFPERRLEISCGILNKNPRNLSFKDLNPLLKEVMTQLMTKMTSLKEELSRKDESVRMLNSLADVYCVFINQLDGDKPLEAASEQVKKFCDELSCDDEQLCKTIVRMAFQSSLRLKFSVPLCPRTARQLHGIYGDLDTSREVEASKNLGYLNPDNADIILPLMIEHMDACIEYADQTIYWIKSFNGQNYPDCVNPTQVELAVTEKIALMVTPSLELVNTALPAGKISEITLKFLCKLYKILGNLANYYFIRTRIVKSCVSASKMDKLVKMVGQQLTPNVYSLITYVHRKLQEQEEEAKQARAKKNKVMDSNLARAKILKETKEIPNLIFQVEMFEKNMAKVSKRINQKFEFKLPTSRDFRIKLSEDQMQELNDDEENSSDGHSSAEEDSDNESQASSQVSSVLNESRANLSDSRVSNANDSTVSRAPPTKKGKLSSKLSKMKENKSK